MPKELFNQTLIETPNEPDDDTRIAIGEPSVSGALNVKWAYFKTLLGIFPKIQDTAGTTYVDTENTADEIDIVSPHTGTDLLVKIINGSSDEVVQIDGNGKTRIGDATDNVKLSQDLGKRYEGDSTVWKDMIMDLFGKRLYATSGKIDYDYDENAIVFQPGGSMSNANDRIGGNQEINHEFKVGTGIVFKPHIHWWQQVTSGAVLPVIFTLRYRLQRNNDAKVTSWTTITADAGSGGDDVFDFTGEADGLYNQITSFTDITLTCGISDTIQVQMIRSDSETGNVSATFIDIHGEVDSDGSDEPISKTY